MAKVVIVCLCGLFDSLRSNDGFIHRHSSLAVRVHVVRGHARGPPKFKPFWDENYPRFVLCFAYDGSRGERRKGRRCRLAVSTDRVLSAALGGRSAEQPMAE
jgi:hypothetical protein